MCIHSGVPRTQKLISPSSEISFLYNASVPLGLLSWEIRVAFPGGKLAATDSRYPTYGASGVLVFL